MSELSRETNALLEEGRHGESFGPADKARLKRAVLAQVAAASVVATTSTAAAWTTVTAKVVGAVVLVSAVAGGGAAVVVSRAKTAKVAASSQAAAAPVGRTAVAAPATHARVDGLPAAPALPVPVEQAAAPSPAPILEAPAARTAPRAPVAIADRAAASNVPSANAPPSNASTSPRTQLDEQTALLRDADDALKQGDPDRALRLLSDLAGRFPASPLAPERAAERIFALCMAGRHDEARDAARTFLASEPSGPLAARVRASCGAP